MVSRDFNWDMEIIPNNYILLLEFLLNINFSDDDRKVFKVEYCNHEKDICGYVEAIVKYFVKSNFSDLKEIDFDYIIKNKLVYEFGYIFKYIDNDKIEEEILKYNFNEYEDVKIIMISGKYSERAYLRCRNYICDDLVYFKLLCCMSDDNLIGLLERDFSDIEKDIFICLIKDRDKREKYKDRVKDGFLRKIIDNYFNYRDDGNKKIILNIDINFNRITCNKYIVLDKIIRNIYGDNVKINEGKDRNNVLSYGFVVSSFDNLERLFSDMSVYITDISIYYGVMYSSVLYRFLMHYDLLFRSFNSLKDILYDIDLYVDSGSYLKNYVSFKLKSNNCNYINNLINFIKRLDLVDFLDYDIYKELYRIKYIVNYNERNRELVKLFGFKDEYIDIYNDKLKIVSKYVDYIGKYINVREIKDFDVVKDKYLDRDVFVKLKAMIKYINDNYDKDVFYGGVYREEYASVEYKRIGDEYLISGKCDCTEYEEKNACRDIYSQVYSDFRAILSSIDY